MKVVIILACAIAAHGAVVRPGYGAPAYVQPDYSDDESRDGYVTKGSYSVALPDGRVQTVTYNVDGYNGYVADVSYSGEPQYPEYQPAYKPVYHAAPVYRVAPSYHA